MRSYRDCSKGLGRVQEPEHSEFIGHRTSEVGEALKSSNSFILLMRKLRQRDQVNCQSYMESGVGGQLGLFSLNLLVSVRILQRNRMSRIHTYTHTHKFYICVYIKSLGHLLQLVHKCEIIKSPDSPWKHRLQFYHVQFYHVPLHMRK